MSLPMAGGLDWVIFKAPFQSKVLSIFFFFLFEPPEQNSAFKHLKIIIRIYHTFSLREVEPFPKPNLQF